MVMMVVILKAIRNVVSLAEILACLFVLLRGGGGSGREAEVQGPKRGAAKRSEKMHIVAPVYTWIQYRNRAKLR